MDVLALQGMVVLKGLTFCQFSLWEDLVVFKGMVSDNFPFGKVLCLGKD